MTNMIPQYEPYEFRFSRELFAHWVRTALVAIASKQRAEVHMVKLVGFQLQERSKFDAKITVHRLPWGRPVHLLVWVRESRPPEVAEKVLWIMDVSKPGVVVN